MLEHIILVRHLHKDVPRPQAFYGSTDVPIIDKAIDPVIHDFPIFSSPMLRCRQTAEKFFPESYFEILTDARECDFGDWEGMTFQEIADLYPNDVNEWKSGKDFTFPNGERIKDFSERVEKMSVELLKKQEKNIVLVTHAGVIRFMICYFLGIEYTKSMAFNIDPGSFSCLKIFENGMGVAHKLNSSGDQNWLKLL